MPLYDESLSLTENVTAYERAVICRVLESSANVTEAARRLGLSRQTLSYKLEKYHITK